MDDIQRFLTIMGAIFAATQGIVEQLKARWPWLGKEEADPVKEEKRKTRVLLTSAVVAALLAGMAAVDVFAMLGINGVLAAFKAAHPTLYRLLNMVTVGLLSTFGSPFLHEILDILIEFKQHIRLRNQDAELKLLKLPSGDKDKA
ncbi:MAG: hypothetical protein L5656_06625 [Thermanaeromonas sp.]|uniref:hypothetical protein n=1 Tax=Thermanaeromonas sp. TaxID=2003697 RepID=UPI00243AD4EC|nr:hypothetical protein [Thermanaeromonas sp.]MCG0278190.1 hypothetical protein [Thermanaeromonas sp.]